MKGGKVSIPMERHEEFLQHLAGDVINKRKQWTFSELCPPTFRFFLDCDFNCDITTEDIDNYTELIHEIITLYYPDIERIPMIVCTTDPKITGDQVKTGLHIHFPTIIVNKEYAHQIRFHLIIKLNQFYPVLLPWNLILDKNVYDGGIKLLYCSKPTKCTDCVDTDISIREKTKALHRQLLAKRKEIRTMTKEKFEEYGNFQLPLSKYEKSDEEMVLLYNEYNDLCDSIFCNHCDGTGIVSENRFYKPYSVIDVDDDEKNKILTDIYYALSQCSIRTTQDVMDIHIPEGYSIATGEFASITLLKEKKSLLSSFQWVLDEAKTGDLFKNDLHGIGQLRGTKEQIFDATIQDYITSVIHSIHPYQTVIISGITKLQNNSYFVKVSGENSRYCENKNGNHSSNTVYFHFINGFCKQRCFSRREVDRLYGRCSDYVSTGFRLANIPDGMVCGSSNGHDFVSPCTAQGVASSQSLEWGRNKKRCGATKTAAPSKKKKMSIVSGIA
jgi:hypothetical protein